MLKRIFSYMKEYKKYAWLALICIGVEVMLEIMVPKLMADLIDTDIFYAPKIVAMAPNTSSIGCVPSTVFKIFCSL